jgi:AraC-like DNA-binding protein
MALSADYSKIPYETSIPVLVYENTENKDYPLHWHSAIEIIMPLKYEYHVRLLKESYRLREGDILIIPSCEPHNITVPPAAGNGKRIILLFEPALLYALPGLSESVSVMYSPNHLNDERTPEVHGIVQSILLAIYSESLRADALKEPAIYAKLIDLCVAMTRYCGSQRETLPYNRQKNIAKLNAVFEYINEHVSDELTLEGIAGIAHFSKYHFERIFKKYTNISFHQYLKYLRVEKAAVLLLNPRLAITQAAQDAGFESIATFNRAFKEIKNCTPSEYNKLSTPPPPPPCVRPSNPAFSLGSGAPEFSRQGDVPPGAAQDSAALTVRRSGGTSESSGGAGPPHQGGSGTKNPL